MEQSRFATKIAARLGRPINGACVVRPRRTILIAAMAAGVGAGVGSVLGDSVGAGVGGGLGAVLGFGIAAVLARRRSPALTYNMALVLTDEGVELHSLGGLLGQRLGRQVLAASYGEISVVGTDEGILNLAATLNLASGETVELEGGKRGVGAVGETFAELGRRAEAVAAASGLRAPGTSATSGT